MITIFIGYSSCPLPIDTDMKVEIKVANLQAMSGEGFTEFWEFTQ